jgi:hypothetical protein
MILRILIATLLGAASSAAQTYAQQFWFSDGAGVELHTETTGQTTVGGGGMISWDEASRTDRVSRFVRDGQDKTIFAYELEARHADDPGAISILIRPFKGPTVSRDREFKAVRYGQEVQLEILANPKTGERVYDVLRPIEGPSPSPGHIAVHGASIPKLVVDGRAAALKGSWRLDQSPRLYIPGHGAFYLAWKSQPKYKLAGAIEKNRLVFLMDGKYVEMTFAGNVPAAPEGGPVWVLHDPNFKPNDGGTVCLLDSY